MCSSARGGRKPSSRSLPGYRRRPNSHSRTTTLIRRDKRQDKAKGKRGLLSAKETSMFARVTTVQGSPNRMDEGIRYFQEQVVPRVAALEGFQGAYLLINRKTGKTVRITFWETTEAEQASAAVVPQIRREG